MKHLAKHVRTKLLILTIGFGALLILGLVPQLSEAQIIVPDQPPRCEPPILPICEPVVRLVEPVTVKQYTVKIEINNQIAHVRVEQVFFNPNEWQMEGSYLFPIPQGAAISDLTLCSEGKCTEGKLLAADEARRIYHDIVRKTLDPALLEYVGDRAFQVKVFPIPAKGESKIELSYQQILQRGGNLVELVYPLSGEKPIEQFVMNITIKDDEPIANIYSPSHKITPQKLSEREAKVSFEGTHLDPKQDFVLYYSLTREGWGIDVLTYKEKDEDGYFILLLSPAQFEGRQALPKDMVFVFDISGSMEGEKIAQAKQSLKHAISKLNEKDRVGLVVFSDLVREFKQGLLPVGELNKDELHSFIDGLEAGGSTDINKALLRGLEYFDEGAALESFVAPVADGPGEHRTKLSLPQERLKIIVFLTDGEPTVGETDPAKIAKSVLESNKLKVRLFVFGVGYDVNAILLDRISVENGGFSTYVEPGESIEHQIAQFYDRVGAPLLTDLLLNFGNLKVYDLYPPKLPDLFRGSQIQIAGRYSAPGVEKAILGGHDPGDFVFDFEMTLPQENTNYSFIPRIWASRKIGYLLEQIRLHGENKELVDTIKKLAEKFGIVTPYTSYLAQPEGERVQVIGCPTCLMASSGASAIMASEALQDYKSGFAAPSSSVKQAGRKTFVLKDGVWVAPEYAGEKTIKVKFGSEAYFGLADIAKDYLALGNRVIFPWHEKFIEVAQNEGITSLEELKQLGTSSTDQKDTDMRMALTIVTLAALAIAWLAFFWLRR